MESKALQAIQRRGEIKGQQEGKILTLITMVQKKMKRGDSPEKIADDLIEDENIINPIYQLVKENPDKTQEEIYNMLEF